MINYAGLGRILFPTMNIKIIKYIDIIKGIKPGTKQSTVKNSHIRIKINIWNLVKRDLTNLKFLKFHFTQQHADYIKLKQFT